MNTSFPPQNIPKIPHPLFWGAILWRRGRARALSPLCRIAMQ